MDPANRNLQLFATTGCSDGSCSSTDCEFSTRGETRNLLSEQVGYRLPFAIFSDVERSILDHVLGLGANSHGGHDRGMKVGY